MNTKRIVALFLTMSIGVHLLAQTVTQKGIAYRYNGAKPRTPLENVSVSCSNALNGTALSGEDGVFILEFANLSLGERIVCSGVKKREMIVFNQQAVDEWTLRKEPLTLVLADKAEFARQKDSLKAIGYREAMKKYEREKAEWDEQYKNGQIALAEKESKLNDAWDRLERYKEKIDQYADFFARIDESEQDSLAMLAIVKFKEGAVEESIRLFETGNYMERLKKDCRVIEQAEDLEVRAREVKAQAEDDRIKDAQALRSQAEAYRLINDWRKEGEIRKALADLVGGDFFEDYIGYCIENSMIFEQRAYRLKEIEYYRDRHDTVLDSVTFCVSCTNYACDWGYKNPDCIPILEEALSRVQYNDDGFTRLLVLDAMCRTYMELRDFDGLEHVLPQYQAINIYPHLKANLFREMGSVYESAGKTDRADELYQEAGMIYQKAVDEYGEKGKSVEVAKMYTDWGKLCIARGLTDEGERKYRSALDAYGQSLDRDAVLKELAKLYNETGQTEKAEAAYLELEELTKEKVQINHAYYLLTYLQKNIADFYSETGQYEKSENKYKEAIASFGSTVGRENEAYLLASLYYNLAQLYQKQSRMEECIQVWEKVLELTADRTENIVYINLNIGALYGIASYFNENVGDHDAALPWYLKLIALCHEHISLVDAVLYSKGLLEPLLIVASIYYEKQDSAQCELYAREAMELSRRLWTDNPGPEGDYYAGRFIWSASLAAEMARNRSDNDEAESLLKEALSAGCSSMEMMRGNAGMISYCFRNLCGLYRSQEKTDLFLSTKEQECAYYRSLLDTVTDETISRSLVASLFDVASFSSESKAADAYLEALSILRTLTKDSQADLEKLAFCLNMLGKIRRDQGLMDEAVGFWDESSSLYEMIVLGIGEDFKLTAEWAVYLIEMENELAYYYHEKQNLPSAIRHYSLILQYASHSQDDAINPDYLSNVHINVASCCNSQAYVLFGNGDMSGAIELVNQAIGLDPERANYYDSKGELLLAMGDADGALAMWQKVLELNPSFVSEVGETPLYVQLKERGLIQ